MNLDQLSYPIAIASAGSLSGAARKLGISESALSRYLEKLEQEVGMPLFISSRRRMYPTQAGRAYIRTARKILEVMDNTRSSISRLGMPETRVLRVGTSSLSGARIFAAIYMEFRARFPDVKLQPVEGYGNTTKEMLRKGECDAVFTTSEEEADLDCYIMGKTEIVLAIPQAQDHPSLPQDYLTEDFSPLRNLAFVQPEEPNTLCRYVNDLMQRVGFRPQVTVSTPNIALQRQLISRGAGVGFLPRYHAEADPSLRILPLWKPLYTHEGMFCRRGTPMTPEMEYLQFLWLRESMKMDVDVVWNQRNRRLLWDYAPEIARELEPEGEGWE